jgi:hypothetical protein
VSIGYHHYELNDGNVVDDLKVLDDDRQDDLNTMDVEAVVVVEEVVVVVVENGSAEVEDDDVDDQDDEKKQMVLIEMMIEANKNRCLNYSEKRKNLQISIDEQMVWLIHLDYVDYRMMNVMKLVVVEVENLMVVEDLIDHRLDHHHHLILMMKHSNHVHRLLNPSVICLSNM